MARYPAAEWRGPIPNFTPGTVRRPAVGVVFHIMGASLSAADAWFHNPNARASAHFGIANSGHVVQWVDTDDKAWHAMAANTSWIGVETEGVGGALAAPGLQAFGHLLAWLHQLYDFPLAISDAPNVAGIIGHGEGGSAWGNHPYCPGADRLAQRPLLIQLAGQPPAPIPDEDDVTRILNCSDPNHSVAQYVLDGGLVVPIADTAGIKPWEDSGARHIVLPPADFDQFAKLAH